MKVFTPLPGIPLNVFDKARELYRDVRWDRGDFRWRITHFYRFIRFNRRREVDSLLEALEAGGYNVAPVTLGTPLRVESLQSTMQVVTFDERYIKLT